MRKIGITGGLGSGKSLVAGLLRNFLNTKYINADLVCRQLLEPGENGLTALQKIFGDRFLAADGSLDRVDLRKAIFKEEKIRTQVNELLHPLVLKKIVQRLESFEKKDNPPDFTLVEVPLLYEAGWKEIFQSIIVVYADKETCIRRVMERDGVKYDETVSGFDSQMSLLEKVSKADYVINNSGNMSETYVQTTELVKNLQVD